jgi:hypothetical protein
VKVYAALPSGRKRRSSPACQSVAARQRRYLTRLLAGKSNAELAYLKKQFAQLAQAKRQAAAQWQAEKAALKAEIAALKRVKPRKSTPSARILLDPKKPAPPIRPNPKPSSQPRNRKTTTDATRPRRS